MAEKANLFGDVRAEQDHQMLESSFFESQDYRTIFEDPDRFVVVGRRGTGKSALTYRLSQDWKGSKSQVLVIAPTEEQVLGLRPIARSFGSTVNRIRAGIKLGWRYAILLEVAIKIEEHYKHAREISSRPLLAAHVKSWKSLEGSTVERLRCKLREILRNSSNEEDRIADLPALLKLNKITEEAAAAVAASGLHFVVLIDRLDEGYEPDDIGVGIVDGILYGTDEVRIALGTAGRPVVFIRDNILRAIQNADNDFSRNLESQVIRLHWDPQELLYLATKRIRTALSVEKESDIKVWNAVTANELHGREGFKRCLKLTLYRPRDLIALLNTAFYHARRNGRSTFIDEDFKSSAKQISDIRFDELGKEYEAVFPGIAMYTRAFANGAAKLEFSRASDIIDSLKESGRLTDAALQHYEILGGGSEIVKALFGVGFVGFYDQEHSTFIFSHDGKKPNRDIESDAFVMIHPCYWPALGFGVDLVEEGDAEEIFDEYEVRVTSSASEMRKQSLGQLMEELRTIPFGLEGADHFEDWCKRAIEIAFAKQVGNIQLKANRGASQRRDIVGTNQGTRGFWRRVREDYGTRQVVFEIKNFRKIGVEEFRQTAGYLGREYGRLGFIVCRDDSDGLIRGGDLEPFREFYAKDSLVIMKLPAVNLCAILSKLRNPEKFDAGNAKMEKLLDTYIRMYAVGQTDRVRRRVRA